MPQLPTHEHIYLSLSHYCQSEEKITTLCFSSSSMEEENRYSLGEEEKRVFLSLPSHLKRYASSVSSLFPCFSITCFLFLSTFDQRNCLFLSLILFLRVFCNPLLLFLSISFGRFAFGLKYLNLIWSFRLWFKISLSFNYKVLVGLTQRVGCNSIDLTQGDQVTPKSDKGRVFKPRQKQSSRHSKIDLESK